MPRIAIAVALLLGIAPVSASDRACDVAYREFMHRMNTQADTLSGHRLAFLQRQGLRIFDACDTGHLRNPEARLRALEISSQ
jgi:hypothetical protein